MYSCSLFVSILLLKSSSTMYSQVDTSSIYKQSRHIRKKFCKHPTVLAAKLTKELEDDASKVLAISYWITKNIKYDYAAYLSNTLNRHSNEQILRRRVAFVVNTYHYLMKCVNLLE